MTLHFVPILLQTHTHSRRVGKTYETLEALNEYNSKREEGGERQGWK